MSAISNVASVQAYIPPVSAPAPVAAPAVAATPPPVANDQTPSPAPAPVATPPPTTSVYNSVASANASTIVGTTVNITA